MRYCVYEMPHARLKTPAMPSCFQSPLGRVRLRVRVRVRVRVRAGARARARARARVRVS